MVRPQVDDQVPGGIDPLRQRRLHGRRIHDLAAQRGEIGVVPGHAEGHFLAPQRLVLAQRMAHPVPRQQDAPQVGVALVVNAHQIVGLALLAEGRLPQRVEAGHRGLVVRTLSRHRQRRMRRRWGMETKLVDAGSAARLPGRVRWRVGQLARSTAVRSASVDEAQPRLVAQKARDSGKQIAGSYGEVDLTVDALHIHHRTPGRRSFEPRFTSRNSVMYSDGALPPSPVRRWS